MREGLINDIERVAQDELLWSYDNHGKFPSQYHGYAILLEEVRESAEELQRVMNGLENVWQKIRNNEDAIGPVKLLKETAKLLACEATQVAAMAEKYIESSKGWKK